MTNIFTQTDKMLISGFLFFHDSYSTYPLIARKWRQRIPLFKHIRMRIQNLDEVLRKLVDNSS